MKKFLVPLFIGAFLNPPLSLFAQPTRHLKPGLGFSSQNKEKSKGEPASNSKIMSISVGVVFGAFAGGVIGTLFGDSRAYNGEYVDLFRGGLIGASLMPFLFYEKWAVRQPLNTRYFVFGGNTTFANYKAANLRPGYSLGLGRNYRLSDKIYLQGEAAFNRREFFLPRQSIHYNTGATNEVWHSDVEFSVAYVEVALLTKIRVHTFDKAKLHVALGPAMSVQVLDKTEYNIRQRERVVSGSPVKHDFIYITDEAGATSPCIGLMAAVELEAGKLLFKASLNQALYASNQIFPLMNETRLRTLMLSLGHKFSKQR